MVFCINLARVVFAPLIEPIRATTGASDATLGLLATMVWAGSALPRLPTGVLLTRISRAKVIFGSGVVLTIGTTFTALAFDPTLLLVGAFTMGIASGVYLTAANTLVSELFPERPGRALGQHGVAAQLAAVGAPALISFVLIVGTWRTALQGIAVAAGLVTVAFTIIARRSRLPDAGSEDRDLLGAARAQWHIIVTSVATIGVAGLVWNGLFNFYVTYATSVGLTPGRGRTLLLLAFGAGVPAFYVSGRLADRLPSIPYLLTMLAAFTGCVLVLPSLTGFWSLAAFSVVVGYVIHSIFPAVDAYLLGSLPDRHRASAYATYGAGMMLLQAPGSALVGRLLDAGVTFPTLLRGMGIALLVVLVAMVSLHRNGRLPSAARA
ncbi:MFS transporter [Haloarcula taiwanensis]|uniref:MFS transporter n=1 Tax=Haloarcula taiwanensis TaxID=1932004 RepID=A0A2H5A2C9_9EURY|nr:MULTISPECIES: MFS transporter [Haloarcula]AUG48899.1 MFS transporter [Haloarcula taiwanensis]RLM40343.1 MFS transporter [Haloarcula sp. Atlit-120R]RLM47383.1 MFS transporter [Haloarcula sp. Atlit-47R]RLM97348.1 MFS transporter [Haloarcula sp. Atlit-7R]